MADGEGGLDCVGVVTREEGALFGREVEVG